MPEHFKLRGTAAARVRTCMLITSLLPLWAAATVTPQVSEPGAPAPAPAVDRAGEPAARAGSVTATLTVRQNTQHVDQRADAPAPLLSSSAGRFGPAAAHNLLERTRGGADAIASDTRLQGSVSNNSASHMTTGTNRIDNGSFAGAVGLPVVIQNSGANVLIQNATVINLQLK